MLRTALALGETDHPRAAEILLSIAIRHQDPWIERAIISSSNHHAAKILAGLFKTIKNDHRKPFPIELASSLLRTAEASGVDVYTNFGTVLRDSNSGFDQRLRLASCFASSTKSDRVKQMLEPDVQ